MGDIAENFSVLGRCDCFAALGYPEKFGSHNRNIARIIIELDDLSFDSAAVGEKE